MRIFEDGVFAVPSGADVFNPYRDCNSDLDLDDAPRLRRLNLESYVRTVASTPRVVVVAEAPGPWGCRFSGVPITSESQLLDVSFPVDGRKTSRASDAYSEYSAGIFWRVMLRFFPRFFVWNAFPLHPHREGEPTTIRTPRTSELRSFIEVTAAIVDAAGPVEVVALGRKAEQQLGWAGIESRYVRHPSQGGAVRFEQGMTEVFGGIS
ncbi:MAG: uracil-DNA glycosylase [Rhodothermia bacterium]|nr:uracil-DNA glycosylase [Rhodothermia bacterium]